MSHAFEMPFRLIAAYAVALLLLASCSSPEHDFCRLLAEAYSLIGTGDYEKAQLKALEAEQLVTDNSSLRDRESLARLFGCLYYPQNIKAKAGEYWQEALRYSTELNDTSLMIVNHFNLGLCAATARDGTFHFTQAAELAGKSGDNPSRASALEKLAQVCISTGDFNRAGELLDESAKLCEDNHVQHTEVDVTRCRLLLAEGNYDEALKGYEALATDSLNIYGRLIRVNAICDILAEQGDYRNSLIYKDSVCIYTDSISRLDGTRQAEKTESDYRADMARKNLQFRILTWSSVGAIAAILIILFFVVKNLRLRKRQALLAAKIAALNARIAELRPKDSAHDDAEDTPASAHSSPVTGLIEQKFELSLEMFRSLPEYPLLGKLNLIHDLSAVNKTEVKAVYDVIVGRFADCCSDLHRSFPGMTHDDCIFCTMNFTGCSKEVMSAAMGSSEEALRRRKSRIKQKLPQPAFLFFFAR